MTIRTQPMNGHLAFSAPGMPLMALIDTAISEFKARHTAHPTRIMLNACHADRKPEIAAMGMEVVITNSVLENHCWVGAPKADSKVKREKPARPTMKDIVAKHQQPDPAVSAASAAPAPTSEGAHQAAPIAPPRIVDTPESIVDTPESIALSRALAGQRALPAPKPVLMLAAPKVPIPYKTGFPLIVFGKKIGGGPYDHSFYPRSMERVRRMMERQSADARPRHWDFIHPDGRVVQRPEVIMLGPVTGWKPASEANPAITEDNTPKRINPEYIEAFRAAHADLNHAPDVVRWQPVLTKLVRKAPPQWIDAPKPAAAPAPTSEDSAIAVPTNAAEIMKQIAKQKSVKVAIRMPAEVLR